MRLPCNRKINILPFWSNHRAKLCSDFTIVLSKYVCKYLYCSYIWRPCVLLSFFFLQICCHTSQLSGFSYRHRTTIEVVLVITTFWCGHKPYYFIIFGLVRRDGMQKGPKCLRYSNRPNGPLTPTKFTPIPKCAHCFMVPSRSYYSPDLTKSKTWNYRDKRK